MDNTPLRIAPSRCKTALTVALLLTANIAVAEEPQAVPNPPASSVATVRTVAPPLVVSADPQGLEQENSAQMTVVAGALLTGLGLAAGGGAAALFVVADNNSDESCRKREAMLPLYARQQDCNGLISLPFYVLGIVVATIGGAGVAIGVPLIAVGSAKLHRVHKMRRVSFVPSVAPNAVGGAMVIRF